MKQKVTKAKKARRVNLHSCYQGGVTSMSVFERRVRGIYGHDSRSFDQKHPSLENAVDGMRQRIAQARSEQDTNDLHRN